MATNLWTDVEALDRLARSARSAEDDGDAPDGDRAGGPAGLTASDGLLPQARRPEFELATTDRPARVVSGDLLDAFLLGDRHLGLVLGDVSGKGIPAGVLGAFTRSIVRHVAPLGGSPGETLTRVNRILCGARLDAVYVTLFLGCLDLATGRLSYANAGHPPALLRRRDGGVVAFGGATGPILGILDRRTYDTGSVTLAPGNLLALYTDGVTEAEDDEGRFYGLERLSQLLARHGDRPPSEVGATLGVALDAFEAGRRHDDATLLALRFLAP